MKTAIFSVALRSAVAAVGLTLAASHLTATTVTWISGGPNNGYPSGAGYVDGDMTAYAEYNTPCGLAMDQTGDFLFVADRDNNAVRILQFSINTTGTMLTYTNNVIAGNLFSKPVGVAVDDADNVFVLNRAQNTNGTVMEFDYTGELIATNMAHITNAGGIALDPNDNIYVTSSNSVFRISISNTVTTVATIAASNSFLQGIVVKPNGILAVCDTGRNGILLINPNTGLVTTNAGFHGQGDFITLNNIAYSNTATFFQPSGIAVSGDGTLIVSDFGNDRVKAVLPNGTVTNVYGVSSNDWIAPYPGFSDGTVSLPDQLGGVAACCPMGVVVAPDGSVYTSEDYYHIIQHVTGANFQPPPPPPPAPPTGLAATVVTNAGNVQVYLQWNTVQNGTVTNYLVERSTSSGGPYSIIDQTTLNTFTDTSVLAGITYYYVVVGENNGGEGANSVEASVTIPIPPPPPPSIGTFDYEYNGTIYVSVFHTNSSVFATENDLNLAINPNTSGVFTYYVAGPAPLSQSPTNNGSSPPPYQNGQPYGSITPLPVNASSNLTIKAVNENGVGEFSSVVSVQIFYQCGSPAVLGTNAADFLLTDPTTNVVYYYTTDGTDPLTNTPPSQQIVSSNGLPTPVSINISSNFTFSVRAFRAGYAPSSLYTNEFLSQNFQNNQLTWGFASGEASSRFIASPGETFYAPVTLTTLPGISIYSMQFNMVETNLGSDPVLPGQFSFESMLKKPQGQVLVQIPPLMFISDATNPPLTNQIVTYEGTNFVNLEQTDTNLNELAVGWYEMFGQTNLYNTGGQDLIAISQAYIDVYNPPQVIVGAYGIQIPTNAQPGEQYEIQLNRPSADSDGLGASGSAVTINLPTIGSLSNGPVNSIKIITVGQPKYLVGDVYPFQWFNAGDFGHGDLITYGAADVQDVFDAATYGLNYPLFNPASFDSSSGGFTNVSDMYDAMDSAGGIGVLDGQTGYWTNSGTLSGTALNALFSVNDNTTINEMAFGDGKLDVCDVFVTFVRSEFSDVNWFQRFYTNDTAHSIFGRVAQAITSQTNVQNAAQDEISGASINNAQLALPPTPVSITNTPTIHFAVGDYLASAGQSLSIPVCATVYGPYPARMVMFNVNVTPLDGSPPLTSVVSFSPANQFNNSGTYNTITNYTVGNCAAAFLPTTLPIPSSANITGSNVIGYLNLTIPTNATSMSAYALSFGHASASPNGLISFPRTTYTGLITLSSRTNSSYNDGIPDSWRLRYFGTIYNDLSVSNADADGTGMNNWQKYHAGLNPMDRTSVLNEGMDQGMAQNLQDAVIYWPSINGKTYVVKRSSTLFPPRWTSISTNIGDGTYMEIHDTAGGNSRYYQVITQ